jgi:hypothetical protein
MAPGMFISQVRQIGCDPASVLQNDIQQDRDAVRDLVRATQVPDLSLLLVTTDMLAAAHITDSI